MQPPAHQILVCNVIYLFLSSVGGVCVCVLGVMFELTVNMRSKLELVVVQQSNKPQPAADLGAASRSASTICFTSL